MLYSLATSSTLIRVNFHYINTLSFSCKVVSYVATFYNYIYCRSSMQTKINVIASQHENNFIFNVMQSIIWPLKTKKSFFETHKYICKLSLWLIWNYISSLWEPHFLSKIKDSALLINISKKIYSVQFECLTISL